MSRARTWIIAAIVVVLFGAAYFGFFFFRDNFSTHYPLKVISARVFRAGAIPYWNVHDAGGQPLAGNPNALTFYPDNVLYLFLPAHVAFNLHFLLHLTAAFLAMRALLAARGCSWQGRTFGAALYALSGMAVSATAFYNLVVYVALIPLALNAVERRSMRMLAVALGLMVLAVEPVMILAAMIAVLIAGGGRMPWVQIAGATALAAAIGSPQILAYAEIAGEVERVLGFSAQTTLNASLSPMRLLEIFIPLPNRSSQWLFSTLFLGVIAVPALIQRSRYVLIAAVMAFLALGQFNPIVATVVNALPAVRVARYPEKFAMTLIVVLVVLSAHYFDRTRWMRAWILVTFVPLLFVSLRALPVDWFEHYRVAPVQPARVYRPEPRIGKDVRQSYRRAARELAPLFGAVAGLRYTLLRSPDNMHSVLSRVVAERFDAAPLALRQRYARIAGADVPGALPYVWVVPRVTGARHIHEAVALVEKPDFDESRAAVAPARLHGFTSAPATVAFRQNLQSIDIEVKASGLVLLQVNESYFASWTARVGDQSLETLPVNIDRLGVLVPPGLHRITLTFGRRKAVIALAWTASSLLLLGSAIALAIEERQRGTGQIE